MTEHPTPSRRARELVRGAYDIHLHVAPDVMKRRTDDFALAKRFAEVGLAGFVLKSHYVPTTERAMVVRHANAAESYGSITLNASVGGMNPVAVEIAGRGGAKFVWLPTVDSANQQECHATAPAGASEPMWAQLQADLRAQGMAMEPVQVFDSTGEVLDVTRQVLRLIARHGMVLATGHLHSDEILRVVEAAVEEHVEHIVVTHPEFTSQRVGVERQIELAASGALLERCFTTPYTGKVSWKTWLSNIRDVGAENSVISSDLGQPFNPPVEDGLALAADHLLEGGFSEEEIRQMTVHNSRWLVGAKPLES